MVKKSILIVLFVLTALVLAAFAPAAQPAAAYATTPTPTPAAQSAAPEGFKAWCLPKGSVVSSEQLASDVAPANAKPMKVENGTPVMVTVNDACFFSFTLAGGVPEGAQLQFIDQSKVTWLKLDLKPGSTTGSAFAVTRHGYIVDPPFWSVTYTLKLVSKDGAELWSSPVVFRRGYEPGKCYDGSWPDPVTWYCYYPPDAHPWDPWYKYQNPTP